MPKGIFFRENKIKIRGQRKMPGLLVFASLVFFIAPWLFFPQPAEAAVAGYTAEKISQSFGSLTMAPGKALTFEASFKNTGAVAWYNNNSRYISLYADSAGKMFRHKYWHTAEQPGKMLETKVLPGQTAHFRFALQAPELLGLQTIKLKMAAENLTWIPGGVLEIPVNVTTNPNAQLPAPVNTTVATADNFQALKLIQSHSSIDLLVGNKINFNVGFKNIGKTNWEPSGTNAVKICVPPDINVDAYREPGWLDTNCLAAVSAITSPGQIGYFNFSMQGNAPGDYMASFILMTFDKSIAGGFVTVPIKILGSPQVVIPPQPTLAEESIIRVGLYSTNEPETIKADGIFDVKDANGNLVFSIPVGGSVTVTFNTAAKNYSASYGGTTKSNLTYLDFIAQNKTTIFEITTFRNPPAWNTSLNDNKFRGNLEFRYSEGRDKVYMINEVPLEAYMKGLAESSNNNPIEYHKALAIAARTYAQYNINIGGKHPAGYFHLNASAYDQVYRGYNSEIRLPNFVKAVEETRGTVVTYNGDIVVTPYFSQSDGRTRAWEEVWFGSGKPWLVSRPDPNCAGMSLFGHGVGLSARGARGMALAGSTFEQILKHYYTGVELKTIY